MKYSTSRRGLVIIRELIFVLLMVFPLFGYSQSCDCPEISDCSPCSGGVTSFTLLYNGASTGTITVSDQMGILFIGIASPGESITFNGPLANGKFTGIQIEIRVNDVLNATINTTCTGGSRVGKVFGDFIVKAGQSLNGGALCCAPDVSDVTPPIIENCPENIEVSVEDGQCEKVVSWTSPVATDNCELLSLTTNYPSGFTFPIGSTEVIYTAADIFGNKSTCTFTVSVLDPWPPKITACPENIIQETTDDGDAIINWEEPQASSCSNLTVSQSHQPGTGFPIGTTLVTYTFTDELGRTAVCSFEVIVTQKEFPFEFSKAITPDGDGINDVWTISNIEKFSDNSVVVTDRWGNTIFSASGYDNSSKVWDGRNNRGDLVPMGTYYYSIQIVGVGGVVTYKKGFLEVVR